MCWPVLLLRPLRRIPVESWNSGKSDGEIENREPGGKTGYVRSGGLLRIDFGEN